MLLKTALEHMGSKVPLMVCEQGGERPESLSGDTYGVLIGPEGGWSDQELKQFQELNLPHLGLGDLTLRAETAAIAAATILHTLNTSSNPHLS
jgi:16S rRNA (uracil1498-N3)-methyltransferase